MLVIEIGADPILHCFLCIVHIEKRKQILKPCTDQHWFTSANQGIIL